MPWKCPACTQDLVSRPTDLPRADRLYRCPVCHLHLMFDPTLQKMRPAPMPPKKNGDSPRNAA